MARSLLSPKKVRLKQLQSLAGSLNFASLAFPLLKVKLKDLYHLKNKYFKHLLLRVVPHIVECSKLLKNSGIRPISTLPISITAYTDAFLSGWRFHYGTVARKGLWSQYMKFNHINALELTTLLLLVKQIKAPKVSHVRVKCDNSTAVNIV